MLQQVTHENLVSMMPRDEAAIVLESLQEEVQKVFGV